MHLISIVLTILSTLPLPVGGFFAIPAGTPPAAYAALRQQAEASWNEKSFSRAHELYAQAAALDLGNDDRRWVAMRLADTTWRADAASPSADSDLRDGARTALEELIAKSGADHDRVWAEANESLGDYFATHPRVQNQWTATTSYLAALDWWAGSADLVEARQHYFAILFRIPLGIYDYGQGPTLGMANPAVRDAVASALTIAQTPEERAHTSFILALFLVNEGRPASTERAFELLESVIRIGKQSQWYDDALETLAVHLSRQGAVVVLEDGTTTYRPDFRRAVELFRRVITEFKREETSYYDEATGQIAAITSPSVDLLVGTTFLPGSEEEVTLTSRNVKEIELSLVPIDLTTIPIDLKSDSPQPMSASWLNTISLEGKPLRKWSVTTNDDGSYVVERKQLRISPRLDAGAYLLSASSGKQRVRQLVLVTDANVLLHTLGRRCEVYVSDATSGAPIAGAHVRLWRARYNEQKSEVRTAETGANGLATIDLRDAEPGTLYVAASANGSSKQAYSSSYTSGGNDGEPPWRVYAFTDRPAYRPDETVHWKFIARIRDHDSWTTPASRSVAYSIVGPRNEKVASGTAQLNAFGSFWSDLALTKSMALGSYRIEFTSPAAPDEEIGAAELFRLEEYKLPEFRVTVTTPQQDGKRTFYRLGDTIEASIDATYYFGGAVANATVEAVVYQQPYYHYWYPWRVYDWYWNDENSSGGPGQVLKRETLRTDANGHAIVRIETPRDGADTSYRIEARVVDASRREVSGQGDVRVAKQRYSVMSYPEHYLASPNQKVSVRFKAVDANDQPVSAIGTVKIIRRWWEETWLDPTGRVVSGREVERLRANAIFPPVVKDGVPWRRTFAGYHEEDVLTTTATTDATGETAVTFTPTRTGYYIALWTSIDSADGKTTQAAIRARDVVKSETALWITANTANELGYHSGGLELVVDRESLRSGDDVPVMVVTPASGRWVVLTTAANDMIDTQVLHLDGTVKLVHLRLDDRFTPSFSITASSIFDRALSTIERTLVVPPVDHFLTVDVKSDRDEYMPRDKGTIAITTRDVDGKPVPAEVSLSVSDDSVAAIGTDPSGDPRQQFFGQSGASGVSVAASVSSQHYARFVAGEKEALVDDRVVLRDDAQLDNLAKDELTAGRRERGLALAPPAPPVMVNDFGVAQAITATASAPKAAPTMMMEKAAVVGNVMAESITAAAASTVEVRHDFRSTAFWQPDVITGKDGKATVTLSYPEALTTWRATARAATTGSQFGIGTSTSRTKMPLIVRLEGPRFFVAGDRAVVSAVINNNSDATTRVSAALATEGIVVAGRIINGAASHDVGAGEIDVPANGEARVEWLISAERAGEAKLRVTARGTAHSDAMEKTFTIYDHGVEALVARSGKLRGDEAVVTLDLPHARRDGSTSLTIDIAPSLAVTMLDALPYLIRYPYGCTEQTMSRFLPAAIVARTLAKNGLDPSDVEGRIFGGIEQAHAAATHPDGKVKLSELDAVTATSMARLYDFQHSDGGWGWWKDGTSDPFMTAYVVWGFSIAKEAGLDVRDDAVRRAVAWLDGELVKAEGRGSDEAWMLHAIAAWRVVSKENPGGNAPERRAFDDAWKHRETLSSYSRALLALAAHDGGDTERAQVLVRNLEDGVRIDRAPDQSILIRGNGSTAETMATVHWGEDRSWWHWYDGPVETTSFVLEALTAIDPHGNLVEPAMNWLVKNRRGAQWNNTRDTAIALIALNDYLRASGELRGNVGYELSVNGKTIATKTIAPSEVLAAPGRFTIDASLIRDANEIHIRRTAGSAPLYFAASARFVSLEEPVTAHGNELFVRRDYFRMAPHPTLLKGVVYERVPLRDGGTIDSGDRVEVVATIETKNDYDYLLFEDLKPAGLEAVELQSGQPVFANELRAATATRKFANGASPAGEQPTVVRRADGADLTGRTAWVYQELRDRNVALFIDHLPQGIWEIRYTLRAETPGTFHALPLLGQAMYVPEIRANGEEVRIEVKP